MRYLHTMVRVKDLDASIAFYELLGLKETRRSESEKGRFTLVFMAPPGQEECPVELTHNWGTEDDPDFGYHNGNDQPQGFGHIGFSVPDVYQACERLESLGVEFVKKPDAGKMKGLAFIKDPDGYWIEILQANKIEQQAAQ